MASGRLERVRRQALDRIPSATATSNYSVERLSVRGTAALAFLSGQEADPDQRCHEPPSRKLTSTCHGPFETLSTSRVTWRRSGPADNRTAWMVRESLPAANSGAIGSVVEAERRRSVGRGRREAKIDVVVTGGNDLELPIAVGVPPPRPSFGVTPVLSGQCGGRLVGCTESAWGRRGTVRRPLDPAARTLRLRPPVLL